MTILTLGTATGDILPRERFKIWGNSVIEIQDVVGTGTGGYTIENSLMNNPGDFNYWEY